MTKIKVANQSEALYAFAAWLTTREGTLKVGTTPPKCSTNIPPDREQ